MNEVKGFSTPPIKVAKMRELIKDGKFADWILNVTKMLPRMLAAIESIETVGIRPSHPTRDGSFLDDLEDDGNEKSKV